MQVTIISLLLINKFRLLELKIEFTRQRLWIETRVEAAQVFLLKTSPLIFKDLASSSYSDYCRHNTPCDIYLFHLKLFFLENVILLSISFDSSAKDLESFISLARPPYPLFSRKYHSSFNCLWFFCKRFRVLYFTSSSSLSFFFSKISSFFQFPLILLQKI